MIGIDTNVLVRFLTRDDEIQFQLAANLISNCIKAGEQVHINSLVMLETEWVLRSKYGLSKAEIVANITKLLEAKELDYEDEESLEEALHNWKESNADFADCMIIAKSRRAGCRCLMTFDAKASRLHGAKLLSSESDC